MPIRRFFGSLPFRRQSNTQSERSAAGGNRSRDNRDIQDNRDNRDNSDSHHSRISAISNPNQSNRFVRLASDVEADDRGAALLTNAAAFQIEGRRYSSHSASSSQDSLRIGSDAFGRIERANEIHDSDSDSMISRTDSIALSESGGEGVFRTSLTTSQVGIFGRMRISCFSSRNPMIHRHRMRMLYW